MATLNELGRNSSSVTYGPYSTGQDLFPTLQAVDTWFRNDTWQGTAVASSLTLTGTGTIWTTQARSGDYIIVAGQQRIVNTVTSDTSMTVTVAFNPAITTPSTIRVVSSFQATQTAGYVSTIVRGATNGTVAVTSGSSTITGTGTYFLSDATNSIATVGLTGTGTVTVAIDTSGNITGTNSQFVTGAGTNAGLYPGDSIAVTLTNGAVHYYVIATVGSDTTATVTVPPTIAISGASIAKATNGVIGRSVNINGRMRTITAIASNTSMTVNTAMDFTDSNLRYKVYPRGTISNASAAGGTLYGSTSLTSSNSTTLAIAGTVTGFVLPGSTIWLPLSSSGTVPAGTTIVNQQFAATATVNNTAVAGTTGTNVLTTSGTQTGTISVGQIVTGNGAAVSGVAAGTYVVGITGTTPNFTITLSQNLTNTVSGTVYFATPGGAGTYTTNNATTTTATTAYFSSLQGTGTNFFWDLGINNITSGTNTAYMYQTSQLDQVWFGDEVRTLNFSSFSGTINTAGAASINAYTTDYVGYSGTAIGNLRQTVFGIPFKREDSYINGNIYGTTTAFLSDLRVGDDLIIDGTECTVSQIVSNTQFKVNIDFTHTTAANSGAAATASTTYSSGGAPAATTFVVSSASNIAIGQLVTGPGLPQGTYVTNVASTTITVSNAFLIQATGTYNFYNGTSFYKKLKLHGYSLEGTREGGVGIPLAANATVSSASAITTTLYLNAAPSANVYPGMQVLPSTVGANSTAVTGLTYITNQQFGNAASITGVTTGSTTLVGTNVLNLTFSPANVAVGMLVQSATTGPLTYGPNSTYVTAVNTTAGANTVTLSNNITTQVPASTTFYFIAPGGQGAYTTSAATTLATAATSFYTPSTGKFTQATTIATTNGTVYPIGTNSLTVAAAAVSGPQYNFVKISGAGGPPQVLSGQVTYVNTVVNGVNTLFTSQLHVGAEIVVAGQYLTVVNIVSDTQLYVAQPSITAAAVIASPTPIYRSVPLYTYVYSGSTTITLPPGVTLKNNLYTNTANPPMVYYPQTGADFLEYVYSAPNYNAEQGTTTLLNTSIDRKYVAFRIWPLFQSTSLSPTNTSTITTAFGAYATPVYERWAASYAQSHGVGINQADLSGGTMVWGYQSTTQLSVTMPVAGSLTAQMSVQGGTTGYPQTMSLLGVVGTEGLSNTTYSGMSYSGTFGSNAAPAAFAASLYGVYDITTMTQTTGGTLFLFGNKRYFGIQGRSAANIQTQWVGCLEFERAQPEDASTGTISGTGITFGGQIYGGAQLAQGAQPPTTLLPGFSQVLQYTGGVAPWPCFAYFNGNRMPTGAQQIPTLPQLGVANYPVHGCVLSVPRVRNSTGDLVGFNAHIYSSLTITTGRWGHMMEFGNYGGSYNPAYLGTSPTVTSSTLTNTINTLPQPHMGQIVPVYTNVYNAKRFMFSPVVVLGPAYDPDVRGRIYGLKVLPSALGTLMDTVSITVDSNYFYNTSFSAADHWVLTTPPNLQVSTIVNPGQWGVFTTRFTLTQNTSQVQQSWRSLEDVSTQATSTATTFLNNFRFAFPA